MQHIPQVPNNAADYAEQLSFIRKPSRETLKNQKPHHEQTTPTPQPLQPSAPIPPGRAKPARQNRQPIRGLARQLPTEEVELSFGAITE